MCVCIYIYFFFFFFATLHYMWNLSFPTRDQTSLDTLHWKHRVLTTGLPGKSLKMFYVQF